MKFKTLLFLLMSLLAVTGFAQTGGGIKGTSYRVLHVQKLIT